MEIGTIVMYLGFMGLPICVGRKQ